MTDVVLFTFWGRRPNIELQLPFIRRILDQHPNVRFDAWNLTRTDDDNQYLRGLDVNVRNDFHPADPWIGFNQVYRHYTADEYRNCLFVKLDDDVTFIETNRFADFTDAINNNPDAVISAKIINNGACTRLEPALWDSWKQLGIPLLDVHQHSRYAAISHQHMIDNWHQLTNQPLALLPCDDWLSINLIGYTWATGHKIAARLGQPSPRHIAGRRWNPRTPLGDEGMVNLLPRKILQGFLAAHLTFGPQNITDEQADLWRKHYTAIANEYLT